MSRIGLSFIQKAITIAIVICLLVTGYSLLTHPGIVLPLRVGLLFTGVLLFTLSSYLIIVWRPAGPVDIAAAQVARTGSLWGNVIAVFWLVEIIAGNLLDPQYRLVRLIYYGSSAIAFTLPFFAGAWGAHNAGIPRAGFQVGLWSGITSGLLTFLSLMAVTYLFLNRMLQDPQNFLQFQASAAPDLPTFVIGDSLAGATGHLVIGLILNPLLGALGGVIGIALGKSKSKASLI
jgi:hypothetical protein